MMMLANSLVNGAQKPAMQQHKPQQEQEQAQEQEELPPVVELAQRIKCGEVYTWDCAGEFYGIECSLCEDRPLCKLDEFTEHMQIWHSSWEESGQNCADDCDDDDHDQEEDHDQDRQREQDQDETVADANEVLWKELKQKRVEQQLDEGYAREAVDYMGYDLLSDAYAEAQMELDEPEECPIQPFEEVLITSDDERDHMQIPAEEEVKEREREREREHTASLEMKTSEEIVPPKLGDATEERADAHAQPESEERAAEEMERAGSELENDNNNHNNNSDSDSASDSASDCSDDTESNDDLTEWHNNNTKQKQNECATKKNLNQEQIAKLIEFYREHPRLWNQSHPEFSVQKLNRRSWLHITRQWGEYCGRHFNCHDVRIRISTLCQRYLKERERLVVVGATAEPPKFTHFDRLQFLDEQQPMQTRRDFTEKQNAQLLEIYRHYPILWHSAQKHIKCPKERERALHDISAALKRVGTHLAPDMVMQRLRALHKWYRDDKRRFLRCKELGTTFDTKFKHYQQMQFLDKHIDPYICAVCGKIFETLLPYREHLANAQHGSLYDSDEEVAPAKAPENIPREKSEEPQPLKGNPIDSTTQATPDACLEPNNELDLLDSLMKEISKDVTGTHDTSPTAVAQPSTQSEPQTSEEYAQKGANVKRSNSEDENMVSSTTTTITGKNELVAKVECQNFSYAINLRSSSAKEKHDEITSSLSKSSFAAPGKAANAKPESVKAIKEATETFARLNVEQTRKMIGLYRMYPQLWNPKHMDFQCRKMRRIAWRSLTAQINKAYNMRYSWKTMHRKLSDYVKYYKRERQRIEAEKCPTKWCFFDDFSFMKEVDNETDGVQCKLRDKDKNWKIIEVYKMHSQLWDTEHPDYTKRRQRQSHVEAMCKRLKEEHNIDISSEKIRQRLIDYRCNYRAVKARRIAAQKRNEPFEPQYSFYEALRFLEPHVAPFNCDQCSMSFPRLKDFVRHKEKLHTVKRKQGRKASASSNDPNDIICHICGLTFTVRSNLVYHLKRHLGLYSHECSVCLKKFYNSTALRVHERIHTKQYACVCEECGRAFVNTSKLNQHMKRHRNQRDYACDKCDKLFYTAFERDRHLRWHLQIRDKICNICGKGFVIGSSYYAHMLLHKDVKRYSCNACGLRFAQYAGLYKHRKTYH